MRENSFLPASYATNSHMNTLTPSLTLSNILLLSHTHSNTLAVVTYTRHTCTLPLSHIFKHTPMHSLGYVPIHIITHTHTNTKFSQIHTHRLRMYTITHIFSLSHTHKHTHSPCPGGRGQVGTALSLQWTWQFIWQSTGSIHTHLLNKYTTVHFFLYLSSLDVCA